MPQLPFLTCDVFTNTRFAGNPLAIVKIPHDVNLTTEAMQTIAREYNLPETVFLHEQRDAADDGVPTWRVRIFLTTAEVPFAGHPTIGTACYVLGTLANNATKGRLVCNAGPIDLHYSGNVATASIPHDIHVHREAEYALEDVYRIQPYLKAANVKPRSIDVISAVKGMSFVFVELPDLHSLAGLKTSSEAPDPTLDQGWDTGSPGSYFYVVMSDTSAEQQPVRLRSRMIKSAFEDPATGSAASALSSLLAIRMRRKRVVFQIRQGVEMGRQSDMEISVTLKENLQEVEKIELSGSSVKVMEGVLIID